MGGAWQPAGDWAGSQLCIGQCLNAWIQTILELLNFIRKELLILKMIKYFLFFFQGNGVLASKSFVYERWKRWWGSSGLLTFPAAWLGIVKVSALGSSPGLLPGKPCVSDSRSTGPMLPPTADPTRASPPTLARSAGKGSCWGVFSMQP